LEKEKVMSDSDNKPKTIVNVEEVLQEEQDINNSIIQYFAKKTEEYLREYKNAAEIRDVRAMAIAAFRYGQLAQAAASTFGQLGVGFATAAGMDRTEALLVATEVLRDARAVIGSAQQRASKALDDAGIPLSERPGASRASASTSAKANSSSN
jgi:hypothetical protein